MREGDDAYLYLYDLEKAFDLIEFGTLLSVIQSWDQWEELETYQELVH